MSQTVVQTNGTEPPPTFDDSFRAQLHALLTWRRDVRRFQTTPIPQPTIQALLETAALAPSVGLSEPWRFVLVNDPARRAAIRADFERCNAAALADQSPGRAPTYARLKLAGLDDAPCQFAVFADPDPAQGHGLGRRTMPETSAYSAVLAVHTIWLTARAQGLGLGWISILDPAVIHTILTVPPTWTFIGYFCLGHPSTESDTPELQRAGWDHRRSPAATILQR